jgi:hypothetical protein
MRLARILLLAPALLIARPATLHAQCTDNSFFPLSVGTARAYKTASGVTSYTKVTSVSGSVVTADARVSTTSVPGSATFTCVGHRILFNLANATGTTPAGPASVNVTSTAGDAGWTIPLPDEFKVFGTAGAGVGQWHHSFNVVTQNGPIGFTQVINETHTVVASPSNPGSYNVSVSVPAQLSGWTAYVIKVDSTTTFGAITGLPAGARAPALPTTPSAPTTIYEWIVKGVGLVQYGPLNGPWTQLTGCAVPPATGGCPAQLP